MYLPIPGGGPLSESVSVSRTSLVPRFAFRSTEHRKDIWQYIFSFSLYFYYHSLAVGSFFPLQQFASRSSGRAAPSMENGAQCTVRAVDGSMAIERTNNVESSRETRHFFLCHP